VAEIGILEARRLALVKAGLLRPDLTGMPSKGRGRGKRARAAALGVIRRFGYLQLDSIAIAGARSQGLVLHSRLDGFDPAFAEELLRPGEPLFEYWGHEACWMPIELYPVFGFRRRAMRSDGWVRTVLDEHPRLAKEVESRIRKEGPLRTADLEGDVRWRGRKASKYAASALWMTGRLAVRERVAFQRVYDLPERVIPEEHRRRSVRREEAFRRLLGRALDGHGWAERQTLAATFRLTSGKGGVDRALAALAASGEAEPCVLVGEDGSRTDGWIRPDDRELAARLRRLRPRRDRGVLLSPFDPVLWDRGRVRRLFGFDQVLEIYKPAAKRNYGYYVLPVLAGDRLVARVDLKAFRKEARLEVLSERIEESADRPAAEAALASALERYAGAVGLTIPRR